MLTSSFKQLIVRNAILRGLPPDEFAIMGPYLRQVSFRERAVLQNRQRPIEQVSFIESGIVSIRTTTADGILETTMVGYHGMVGIWVLLGGGASGDQSVAATPCNALSIRTEDLRRLMQQRPRISEHLVRHVQARLIHSSQVAFCGIRHQLEQRLASWLCLACDAIEGNVVPVTHDYLSTMLGLRRAGVTEALLRFESEGVITKARRKLRVTDRALLSRKACGCYATIASAYRAIEAQGNSTLCRPEYNAIGESCDLGAIREHSADARVLNPEGAYR